MRFFVPFVVMVKRDALDKNKKRRVLLKED
jgi:hypothetical protein